MNRAHALAGRPTASTAPVVQRSGQSSDNPALWIMLSRLRGALCQEVVWHQRKWPRGRVWLTALVDMKIAVASVCIEVPVEQAICVGSPPERERI